MGQINIEKAFNTIPPEESLQLILCGRHTRVKYAYCLRWLSKVMMLAEMRYVLKKHQQYFKKKHEQTS